MVLDFWSMVLEPDPDTTSFVALRNFYVNNMRLVTSAFEGAC